MFAAVAKTPLSSAVALRLRKARTAANLTQQQLADRAGVHKQTIQALELGKHQTPKLSTLAQIASALDIDVTELAPDAGAAAEATLAVERFVGSEMARDIGLSPAEAAWLRALPRISWMGREPNNQTFLYMVEALRKTNSGNSDNT